jgi:four helix bundle protein
VRNLLVYQQAITNIAQCEDLANRLSSKLVDEQRQLLRAARSIPALLAEGYARKTSQKEFLRYIYMTLGSSDEVQAHLHILMSSRFSQLNPEAYQHLLAEYSLLSRQLNVMTQTIAKNLRNPTSDIRYPLSGRRKLTR